MYVKFLKRADIGAGRNRETVEIGDVRYLRDEEVSDLARRGIVRKLKRRTNLAVNLNGA
jgi:hypothetical protein